MLTKRQKKKQLKRLKKGLEYNKELALDEQEGVNKGAGAKRKKMPAKKFSLDGDSRALIIRIVIIVAILIGLFFLVRLIINSISHDSYEVVESAEGAVGGLVRSFDGGLIHYSSSGVKYTDDGELLWDQGYSMENPNIVLQDKYCIIYDKGGTSVVLLNSKGIVSTISTDYPVTEVGLSEYGVAAVMVQQDSASQIYFYDNTGGKLDVEIKNVLAKSSGYPLSMSLSPDGQGVALSLMFLDTGSMQTRISFINFKEGSDSTDRVVGYFEYEDNVYPEVDYLSDSEVVAFGTDKVVFYSLSNPASPKISEEIVFEEEIKSVAVGDGHATVVSKAPEGGFVLTIFDGDGDVELEEPFAFDYNKMEIIDGYVMLYGGENALFATTSGYVKFCGAMEGQTTSIVPLGSGKFMQFGTYGTRTIKLD